MEINLLEIVKSQLSGNILDKAASFLDEDNSSTEKALGAILPSVLGGLVNQATTSNDASQLLNSINSQGHDGSLLDSLGMMFGGGSLTQGLISSGESMNTGLFNNKLGDIVDWIASFAGIKAGSASGLMNMAAPVLMGILGKQIKSGNLDVQGLMSLLGSQTSFIKNALPSGITSVLGLSNLKLDAPSLSTTIQAAKAASDAKVADVIHEDTGFNKILPWILFAVAGLAGMFYLRSCNTKAPEPPQVVGVTEPVATPMAIDTVKKLSLPDGEIVVKTGSFLDQLYTEASDTTLDPTKAMTFDNVNFATGSAQLTEDSKVQLDDLVKIMKGYPKVEIKIDGHTDNKGNESSNKKLSESRAASVKAYLASHGIIGQRMSTAGFGSSKPIAENETEEGRAKNRRIEAFIVKK